MPLISPVVFQGTFDPFTNGHLSVLKNILSIFPEVIVLLLVNPSKKTVFSITQRQEMITSAVSGLSGVKVSYYDGLLADYMRRHGLTVCIRGVRNAQDCCYEQENHFLSRAFYPQLQTLLIPCDRQWQFISSTAVKTACQAGRLPGDWVPAPVLTALQEKYSGLLIV